jgi:hypothetical protein
VCSYIARSAELDKLDTGFARPSGSRDLKDRCRNLVVPRDKVATPIFKVTNPRSRRRLAVAVANQQ